MSQEDGWPELTTFDRSQTTSQSQVNVLLSELSEQNLAEPEALFDTNKVSPISTSDVDSPKIVDLDELLEPLPLPPELPLMDMHVSSQPSRPLMVPFDVETLSVNFSSQVSDLHTFQPPFGPEIPITTPQLPQCQVLQAECQLKKEVSELFYNTFKNLAAQEIHTFECSGGILQYQLGSLIISGRPDLAQTFLSKTVESYSEMHLQVLPSQWKQLMEPCSPEGASKFKELSFPFSTNPNVKIFPIPVSQQLVFVGTAETVENSYQYFASYLTKQIPIDRIKWMGLIKLNPTLISDIHQKYGIVLFFKDGFLVFEGTPDYGHQTSAREELARSLSQCCVECLNQPLSTALLASINTMNVVRNNSVIVFSQEGSENTKFICGRSQTEVLEVKKMIEKPMIQNVNATSSIMSTLKTKCALDVQKIEEECLVEVCYEVKKILVKGYAEINVLKAKNAMIKLVKSIKSTKRSLSCSPPLCAYVHHVLFEKEQSAEHKKLLSSLDTKVYTENNEVLLEGSTITIEKDEEKLLDVVVPKELKFEEYNFSCSQKFIQQIEKSFLSSLHKKYNFVHLISLPRHQRSSTPIQSSRRSSSGHRTRQNSGDEDGFIIFIFATDETNFAQISSSMKELKPQTIRIKIPVKSSDYIQKVKKSLESKYCTWIFVSKSDSSMVTIHGLTENDLSSCKEEIEQSLFTNYKYKVSCHQLSYLRKRCQQKLETFQELCHKFSLPPPKSESKNAYILIIGKSNEIEKVCQQLDEIIGNNHFKIEIFSVKCLQYMAGLWRRQWAKVQQALEEKHEIVVEFTQSEGPKVAGRYQDFHSTDRHVVINFEIFGNCEDVDAAADFIKQKENGTVAQTKLKLPSHCGKISLPQVIKDSNIQELMVWLRIEGNQLVVLAPESAVDDLDTAKSKLDSYFNETATKQEKVDCISSLIFDVMMSQQHAYLTKVSECGRQNHVVIRINKANRTIMLDGSQSGIDIVKPHVEAALQSVQKSLKAISVSVSSIQEPFLKTSDFKSFCEEMRKTKCVEIKVGKFNVLLKQAKISQWLTISIFNGDILSEDVDAIVNAANEDLDHIGGLAKSISDAGGPEVQNESKKYVSMHGRVPTGSAVCLGSGKLSCKKIIHAVAPRNVFGQNLNVGLYNAVKKSLLVASKNQLTSIAIPALGTGIFYVPVDTCAEASLKAVQDFCQENPLGSCLCDVRFIVNTQQACKVFSHVFGTKFDDYLKVPNESSEVGSKTWKWLGDSGKYQTYDTQICERLNESFSKNPSGSCTVNINGTLYLIDFGKMEQINISTHNHRKITFQTGQDEDEVDTIEEHEMNTVKESAGESVQWYYLGDRQQWEPYLPHDSSQLEAWYQSDNRQPGTLRIGKFTYSFDFESMTQKNSTTSNARQIRRQAQECERGDSSKLLWHFENDAMQFQPYTSEDSAQLEEWYQSKLSGGRLTIHGNTYSFDFDQMQQCNVVTGKLRKIKRKGDNAEDVAKKSSTALRLLGDASTIDDVQTKVYAKLESCIDRKDLEVPSMVEFSAIKEVACKFPVKVKFVSTGKSSVAKITGVKSVLQKCVSQMQSVIISEIAKCPKGLKAETPQEWKPQQETVQLFPVSQGCSEWMHIASNFQSTMSDATIVSIDRIQNQWLWQRYFQHKEMIREKNKGAVNEMELFHGTSSNDPKSIYSSEEGFDMRYSASGMWGQGNYFAVNASYSDGYAYKDSSGHSQMFLAKVLTGDSHSCPPNRSLRMPPEKSSYAGAASNVHLEQMRYDTVTGTTGGSTVYMTYDNLKAYPAYLITYQRRSYRRLGIF